MLNWNILFFVVCQFFQRTYWFHWAPLWVQEKGCSERGRTGNYRNYPNPQLLIFLPLKSSFLQIFHNSWVTKCFSVLKIIDFSYPIFQAIVSCVKSFQSKAAGFLQSLQKVTSEDISPISLYLCVLVSGNRNWSFFVRYNWRFVYRTFQLPLHMIWLLRITEHWSRRLKAEILWLKR